MTEALSEQTQIHRSMLRLVRADITELAVDAFVFYAQPDLALGSGFGTAITVRGGPSIKEELDQLGPLATGAAVVTGAGKLTADYIVHAVGPRFNEADTERKLSTTVVNALRAAEEKGARRIALPAMGAGFYGIPLDACARVMVAAIKSYLEGATAIQEVVLCVMDQRELRPFEAQFAALTQPS